MQNIYDNNTFFSAYAAMPRSQSGLDAAGEWHQLKKLFPPLQNKTVLDLGCGYGWHCRFAVACGAASVLGLDMSEKMIAEAEKQTDSEKITYRVCSLEGYAYPEKTFDLVVSNLVLHYIENLDSIYTQVFRTLKPGGIFLFNIEHPIFTSGKNQDWSRDSDGKPLCWPVDDYFISGERVTHFLGCNVVKQHHTLTQILSGLLTAGFSITAIEEAMPPAEMMHLPEMENELRRPMMLLVKAQKPL